MYRLAEQSVKRLGSVVADVYDERSSLAGKVVPSLREEPRLAGETTTSGRLARVVIDHYDF